MRTAEAAAVVCPSCSCLSCGRAFSVSFTQESSCSLSSKPNFYYYLHNITYTLHFYTLFNSKFKVMVSVSPFGEETTNVPRLDYSFADNLGCLDTFSNTCSLDFCNIHGLRSNYQFVEHHLLSTKPHFLFLTATVVLC